MPIIWKARLDFKNYVEIVDKMLKSKRNLP